MTGYVYAGPDAKARIGRPPMPDDPDACGTHPGVWQHKRKGEKNCEKCREFENERRRKPRPRKE